MKKLLLLLFIPLSACTWAGGNGNSWAFGSFGGDQQGLNIGPNGMSATAMNNSTAAGLAKDLGTNYIIGETTKFALDHTMPGGAPAIIDSVKAP